MRLTDVYKSMFIDRLLKEAKELSEKDSKVFKLAVAKIVNQYWPSGLSLDELMDVVKSNFPNGFKNPTYDSFYDSGTGKEPNKSAPVSNVVDSEIPATIEEMVDVYLKNQYAGLNVKYKEISKSEFNKNHLNVSRTKSKITKYWTLVFRLEDSSKTVYYYIDKVTSPNIGVAYLYLHKGKKVLGNKHEVVTQ